MISQGKSFKTYPGHCIYCIMGGKGPVPLRQKYFIKMSFVLPHGMCGAAEASGLGFVCFVVINPRLLSVKS